MSHSEVLSNNSYPEPSQSDSSIDTCFFKINSDIVLSKHRPS